MQDPPIDYCGTPISWCFSSGYCIEKVILVPSSIMALIVGIVTGMMIKKLKPQFSSQFFYALGCFLFAIMMTVAGILHCFLHDSYTEGSTFVKILRLLFGVVDVGLTSNIAITFAFGGLADLKLWSWKKKVFKVLSISVWSTIFIAWFVVYLGSPTKFAKWFSFLYLKVVGVSGMIWFISQIILFVSSGQKLSKKAKKYLLYCMLFSSIGIAGIVPQIGAIYCKIVGKTFSSIIHPMVLWFYFSDFAVLFLALFLAATAGVRENASKWFLPE